MASVLFESRTLPGALGRWLLVAGIALGLAQPRDFVWCQAESGHAALEALDAGCCGNPVGEGVCSTDPGGSPSFASGDRAGAGPRGCTDVLVEAATRAPLGGKVSTRLSMTSPLLEGGERAPAGPGHVARTRAVEGRAVRPEPPRSTILRI